MDIDMVSLINISHPIVSLIGLVLVFPNPVLRYSSSGGNIEVKMCFLNVLWFINNIFFIIVYLLINFISLFDQENIKRLLLIFHKKIVMVSLLPKLNFILLNNVRFYFTCFIICSGFFFIINYYLLTFQTD